MSLTAIPNQPIGFVPSRLQGYLGCDPEEQSPIVDGDPLRFQFGYSPCETVGLLGDPSFQDAASWSVDGFLVDAGDACTTNTIGGPQAIIRDLTFTPTAGVAYVIEFTVLSTSGPIRWVFGGVGGVVTGAGSYSIPVTAINTQPLAFSVLREQSTCLGYADVYTQSGEPTVEVVDTNGDTIQAWTFEDEPEAYAFDGGFMTFEVPADEAWGCFRVKVTDVCSGTIYTSQLFGFVDEATTVPVRACNIGAGMGFSEGFQAFARVTAKVSRPTYDYESATERGTDGFVDNYYAERITSLELRVDGAGEVMHRFLSTLPLWDHVYLRQEEYHVKPEAYEPEYADPWDATGPIVIPIEPKREALRKVRCGPDEFGGCAPPPNYLVQGSGPNEDYIILNTGGRILLHD